MFTAEQLEEKKDEVPKKSDTRMTASILKQNSNTKQRLKRMLFIMTKKHKTKTGEYLGQIPFSNYNTLKTTVLLNTGHQNNTTKQLKPKADKYPTSLFLFTF